MKSTEISVPTRAYFGVAIVLVLAVVPATLLFASSGRGLYMTSGVWGALAVDLSDGQFYRPVFAEDGYGGTRYMPLFFLFHAAILSIIKFPALAAYCVVYPAAIALVGGLYTLLRAHDVPVRISGACATFALAGLSIQYGIISTRGDLLAAAFNIWGVAFCARAIRDEKSQGVTWAALMFSFAFMTKFTTLFGLAASIICFTACGRYKEALRLLASSSALILAGLVTIHFASEGRALDSFLACASGGVGISDFAISPFKFLYSARLDISFLVFFVLGLVTLSIRRRTLHSDLLSLSFIFTLIATVIIMASPGTDLSHLIDLTVISIALASAHVFQFKAPKMLVWSLPIAAGLGAIIAIIGATVITMNSSESHWSQHARVIRAASGGSGPLLADNPWVPILAGERPFMLDNFPLRLVCEQRPEVQEDLFSKIEGHHFRAVVLNVPLHLREEVKDTNTVWRGKQWYGELFYPPGFHERLLDAYEPKAFIAEYIVLLPISDPIATTPSAE